MAYIDTAVYIDTKFWFNRNIGLAIPLVSIPIPPRYPRYRISQRAINRAYHYEMIRRKQKRLAAVKKIEMWWQKIMVKRTFY